MVRPILALFREARPSPHRPRWNRLGLVEKQEAAGSREICWVVNVHAAGSISMMLGAYLDMRLRLRLRLRLARLDWTGPWFII